MNRNKKHLKVLLMLFITALITTNCEKEEFFEQEIQTEQSSNNKKNISLKDFPQAFNYLKQKSSKELKISLDNSTNPNFISTRDNDNITLLTVETENATQFTDENEKSNFTLNAKVVTNNSKLLAHNYMLIQFGDSYYSYIVQYEYNSDWVASQTVGNWDYTTFTGAIRFYDALGIFAIEIIFENGIGVSETTRDPCEDDGVGGSTTDFPEDYDPFGNNPDIPAVGWHLEFQQVWSGGTTCLDGYSYTHGSTGGCGGAIRPGYVTVNVWVWDNINKSSILKNPCDDPPTTEDDPCERNPNDPCENSDIPLTPDQLQENFISLLVNLSEHIPNFFAGDYATQITWLGNNLEIASEILFYLGDEGYSQNAIDLVFLAIDLMMNDENINFNEIAQSFDDCEKVQSLMNDTDILAKFNELKGNTGLHYETGYDQNSNGDFTEMTVNDNGTSLKHNPQYNSIGYLHVHTDEFETGEFYSNGNPKISKPIKIFSPKDVITYLSMYQNATTSSIVRADDVYGFVITSKSSYTLRFHGDISTINLDYTDNEFEELKKLFREYAEDTNRERAFLLFIRDELNIEGLKLYKVRNNGDIEEKFLKPNDKVDKKDCN